MDALKIALSEGEAQLQVCDKFLQDPIKNVDSERHRVDGGSIEHKEGYFQGKQLIQKIDLMNLGAGKNGKLSGSTTASKDVEIMKLGVQLGAAEKEIEERNAKESTLITLEETSPN